MPARKYKAVSKYTDRNKVKIIRGGAAYFNLLIDLINNAAESIHLQTYYFENDETGRMIADALMAAAMRNVSVYLLADGYASQPVTKKMIHSFEEAGVHFRFFEPLLKSKNFYFGRRLHHKIFVSDGRFALTGGINIANRYNDMPELPAWLDFALYAEGEIAGELCVTCWKTWNGFPKKMTLTPCEKKQQAFDFNEAETSSVRMRRNDWVRRKNEISSTYIEMFRNAQSQITIICSYFLPGKIIRRLLRNASERGVKISVITAGPSDVMISKNAERWMYDWLIRNNIKLYEYQTTVLHAKVAVCDSEWLTIGSYNINNISAYASIELNLDVKNAAIAKQMEQTLETIIEQECVHITKEALIQTKNIFRQFVNWLSYQVIRFLFFMVTFYYKRTKL
jgi:cardiolipin synthase A/B